MTALVERIIAARDIVKRQDISGGRLLVDVLADAANAIKERDETIHALRHRLAKVEAFSSVELMNCARYVNEASNAIEGAYRGRELARMVLSIGSAE